MTLVLELTRDEEDQLREQAARSGQDQDVLGYTLGLVREGMCAGETAQAQRHSVMAFSGIGREALRGLDVGAHIRQMRDEWDAPEDDH